MLNKSEKKRSLKKTLNQGLNAAGKFLGKRNPRTLLALTGAVGAVVSLLHAGESKAATYDWSGASSGNMSGTTANWGGTVPGTLDVARWNAATYTNAPYANANMTIGELLFDAGNTGGVTFGTGANTLTLSGVSAVGIQLNSGSGAVTTGGVKFSIGASQSWINNSGSLLTVGGTITNSSTSAARTLTIGGSGNTTLNGVISNNSSGILSLTKTGAGMLTLSGANTFTGLTTIQAGTLRTTTSSNRLASGMDVTFTGAGTLDLQQAQVLDVLTINSGASGAVVTNSSATSRALTVNTITANDNATIGNATLSLATPATAGRYTWTVASGKTLALNSTAALAAGVTTGRGAYLNIANSGTITSTMATTSGILGGGWLTYGAAGSNNDWATVSAGNLMALPSYDSIATPGTNKNVLVTDAGSITATTSYNTLKLATTTTGQSLAIVAGQTLTLSSGGMIFTGANDYSITGGTLKSTLGSTNSDLIIYQNGAGNLTIDSVIANGNGASTLTKFGSGKLILGGTSATTFTGNVYVGGGTLAYSADNTAVKVLTFGVSNFDSSASTLDASAANVSATGLTVQSPSATANNIIVGAGKTLTVAGPVNIFSTGATADGTNVTFNPAGSVGTSTFTVSGANSFIFAQDSSTSSTTRTNTLDMRNLGALNAGSSATALTEFTVGRHTGAAGNYTGLGVNSLYLAPNSTIYTAALSVGKRAASTAGPTDSTLYLGSGTNAIHATTITVGETQDVSAGSSIKWDAGVTTGTLSLSGTGTSTLVANMYVGAKSDTGSSTTHSGTADFSNGTVTGSIGNLYVGYKSQSGDSGTGSPQTFGTFKIGAGTAGASSNLSVGNLYMGYDAGSNNFARNSNGTFQIDGGSVSVTSSGTAIQMTSQVYDTATLNVNGGTLSVGGDIASGGGTTTVTLAGGTLNMGGNDIGSATTAITALNYTSGLLQNSASIYTGLMDVETVTAANATITLGASQVLSVTGPGNGTGSFTLGSNLAGVSTSNKLTLSGAGSLVVKNASANVVIGMAQTDSNYSNSSVLDLSGLSSVTLGDATTAIGELRVGYGTTTQGTLTLSNTANLITATTVQIGNSNGGNASGASLVTLGTGTNVIAADTINIGLSKGGGTLRFASQTAGSPGTVTITNKAGTGAANIVVGFNNGTNTSFNAAGVLDLRGHVANITAGTLSIGNSNMASSGGKPTGTVYFDSGTFTVNAISMGVKTGADAASIATGSLNIGGGNFTVNSGGSFTLASQATAGTSSGTLTITGGTFTSNANIVDGGGNSTSKITLNGGTLNMTGKAIGDGTNNINTLEFLSGTLQNVGSINGTGGLTKTGSGTLTISGTNTYTGLTTVSGGTLNLSVSNTTSGITISGGTNSTVTIANVNASGSGTISFNTGATTPILNLRIDGGGTITLPNAIAGNSSIVDTIDVNNNGTGSNGVIVLADSSLGLATLNVTGGNGYSLSIPSMINNAGSAGTMTFNPTTAALSLGDLTGAQASGTNTWVLGGTNTGNAVTGVISNASAGAVSAVTKSGAGSWTLSSASTYTGATTINGGTLKVSSTGSINVGTTTTIGTATITGSGLLLIDGGSATFRGAGTINQIMKLGDATGGGGITVQNGGSLTLNNGNLILGQGSATGNGDNTIAASVFTQTGGTVTLNTTNTNYMGNYAPATLNLSGGTFTATNNTLILGTRANTALNISGSAAVSLGTLQLAHTTTLAASTVDVNLDGGTLSVSGMTNSSLGTTTFNLNGGTLKARAATSTFAAADNIFVKSGGAIIDDGGYAITIPQALLTDTVSTGGGLTKNGTGSLTLTTANTYTGGTTVNQGTLVIRNASGLGTGAVNLAGGAVQFDTTAGMSIANNFSTSAVSQINALNVKVTLSGTISLSDDITFRGLGGAANQFVLTNAGGITSANNSSVTFWVDSSMAHTVAGPVSIGSGTLTKASTAIVSLNGSGNVMGTVNVAGGTLNINGSSAMGDVSISSGAVLFTESSNTMGDVGVAGTLDLGGSAASYTQNIKGLSGAGSVTTLNSGGYARTLNVGNSNATSDFSGTITQVLNRGINFNKVGSGTQTLSGTGANVQGGGTGSFVTNVQGGTLVLNKTGAVALPGTVNVSGGTLQVSGTGGNQIADTSLVTMTNAAAAILQLNASETIGSLSGGGTTGGNVNLGANTLTVGDGTSTSYAGLMSGTGGALVKQGTGTLTLSGNNSYTGGTTIAGGKILASSSVALGSGAVEINAVSGNQFLLTNGVDIANPLTIHGGGVSGFGAITTSGGGAATYSGDITIDGAAQAGGHFAGTGGTLTIAGKITSSVPVVSRNGTVVFTNTNSSYSALTISQGTLQLGATNALPVGVAISIAGSAAANLDLAGYDQTVAGITKDVTNAAIIGNSSTTNDSTFTTTGTSSFAGVLQNVLGAGTKKLALAVNGGALTLSGANSYTGATNVTDGTLSVNGSLGNTAVAVNSGGTLGGTGTIAGSVTVNSGGHLAPGNSPGALIINNTLTLSSGSVSDFEIASTSSYDQVTGLTGLSYGGTLNVTGSIASSAHTYTLFSLSGDPASGTFDTVNLASAPSGYRWHDYDALTAGIQGFDYSTGQIQLEVASGAAVKLGLVANALSGSIRSDTTDENDENGSNAVGSIHVTGSNGGFFSEIDGLTNEAGVHDFADGYVQVDNDLSPAPTLVMLWLKDNDGVGGVAKSDLITYLKDNAGGAYTVLTSSDEEWQKLAGAYSGFDTIIDFGSVMGTGDAFSWKFEGDYAAITVDKVAVVPEPGSLGLLGLGALGLMGSRRRKNKKVAGETALSRFYGRRQTA